MAGQIHDNRSIKSRPPALAHVGVAQIVKTKIRDPGLALRGRGIAGLGDARS